MNVLSRANTAHPGPARSSIRWIVGLLLVGGLCGSATFAAPPTAAPVRSLSTDVAKSPTTAAAPAETSSSTAEVTNPLLPSTLRTVGTFLIAGTVPTLLLMSTSFIRISIVLALLRQALGSQLVLSPQILTPLALILTCGIMTPTWRQSYAELTRIGGWEQALQRPESWPRVAAPAREFMSQQIDRAGNSADVWLFLEYQRTAGPPPTSYDEVGLDVLLAAFVMSELKTACLMGFQIYLPFLVIDLVVSTLISTVGLSGLSTAAVSLPLKFMLFVMADGWHLLVESLLRSFR